MPNLKTFPLIIENNIERHTSTISANADEAYFE